MKENVVQIIIEGNNVTAIKAIDGTVTKLSGLDSSTKKMNSNLDNIFSGFGAKLALGATAAVTSMAYLLKNAVDTADEIYKLSQKIGITVEELSTMRYAASQSGVEIEVLESNIKRLNKSIIDVSNGNGEAKKTFKDLGIEVLDANGDLKKTDEILLEIADKFKYMPDDALKTSMAMDIFGKSGADLIPFLNAGKDGINALQIEARNLGLEIETKTAKQAEALNDSISRLMKSVDGVVNQSMPGFLSVLADIADGFYIANEAAKNANNLTELFTSLELNIVYDSIIKAQRRKQEVFSESIKLASDKARKNMIDKTDAEVKELIRNTQAKLNALNKFNPNPDENVKNDIAQAQASLEVYKQRFVVTEKQKKQLEEISKLEKDIKYKIELSGMDVFEASVSKIKKEVDELKGKGVSQKLLAQYELTELNKLFEGVFKEGLEIAEKIDTEMNDAILNSLDEELLATLETIRLKEEARVREAEARIAAQDEEEERNRILKQMYIDSFGNMSDAMLNFYQLGQERSRAFFDAYKIFAMAQAAVSGKEAVIHSYKEGSKYGGPILGGIFAATAAVWVASQLAQLASMQPNSKSVGSAGSSVPSTGSATRSMATTNNNQRSVNLSININSEVLAGTNLDKWVRENLSGSIKRAVDDGTINFGGGD